MTFPLIWVLPDEQAEEDANERFLDQAYEQYTQTKQAFDDAVSGFWKQEPRFRLRWYEAHEPVFVVTDQLSLDAWLQMRQDRNQTTQAPPLLVAELLAYYAANQPQPPNAPTDIAQSFAMGAQITPEQMVQVAAYQQAYAAYQSELQRWQSRMMRLEDGIVFAEDVLNPVYWQPLYLWEPKEVERMLREYGQLVKARERRNGTTG
jgi:hypothetical protein